MSRFDRYVLSQLMMVFGFFALVLVSIYWVNSAVRLFDRLISDNQSVWVFLELSALTLPNVIRLMLPVAAFVATLHVTHRLAQESELVVMQATGFSPYRLARPVLMFGLIVTLLSSVLAHVLVPMARTRLNERNIEISENVSSKFLNEGAFMHPAQDVTLFIRHIDENGELGDFFLSDRRASDAETTYTAKRAYLAKSATGPKIVMLNGMAQRIGHDQRLTLTRFENFTYDIAPLLAKKGPRTPSIEERSTGELLRADAILQAETNASRAAILFEGHDRIAKPFLTVGLVLMGFATMQSGAFSRFGMWRQITLACVFFTALFLLSNLADKTAARDENMLALAYLPPLAGLWIAGVFLALCGRVRRPGAFLTVAAA